MSGQTWKPDRSHPQPRYCYTCYLRRTGGSPDCDQPYVPQERLEADLLTILRVVALPEGLAEEVDKAIAVTLTEDPAQSRQSTLAAIESRLARLAELYELNDITREDYLARREELQNKRKTIETSRPQPVFARQRTMLATLVDDWEYLAAEERKALVGEVFEEITASERGIEDFLPTETWKRYMRAVVPSDADRVPTERKTGLEPATLTLAR